LHSIRRLLASAGILGAAIFALAGSAPSAHADTFNCGDDFCKPHVFPGAHLYQANGTLYHIFSADTQVTVTCWYRDNGTVEDHVSTEDIPHPIAGHIPDSSVNFNNSNPWDHGIDECGVST
jgi:hypothetical protein